MTFGVSNRPPLRHYGYHHDNTMIPQLIFKAMVFQCIVEFHSGPHRNEAGNCWKCGDVLIRRRLSVAVVAKELKSYNRHMLKVEFEVEWVVLEACVPNLTLKT